jgi:ABC-2 type transport system ATP-binding protein
VTTTSDPCSKQIGGGSFSDLSLKFFDKVLKGKRSTLTGFGRFHLATPGGEACTTVDSVEADAVKDAGTVATTASAGAPIAFPVAEGPIRIAGEPYLTGKLTTLTPGSRAFLGLGIGTSPADAELVQGNVLPLDVPQPVTSKDTKVDLPAVAVDVPAGETLYVIASPLSDSFVGMNSRIPGAVVLQDTQVHLPVVS